MTKTKIKTATYSNMCAHICKEGGKNSPTCDFSEQASAEACNRKIGYVNS
jgi:hypothetical protein